MIDNLEDYITLLAPLSSRSLAGDGSKVGTTSGALPPHSQNSAFDRGYCRITRTIFGGEAQRPIGLTLLRSISASSEDLVHHAPPLTNSQLRLLFGNAGKMSRRFVPDPSDTSDLSRLLRESRYEVQVSCPLAPDIGDWSRTLKAKDHCSAFLSSRLLPVNNGEAGTTFRQPAFAPLDVTVQ